MQKTQTIELTKKQYLTLMKAVYIGNWVANAQSIPSTITENEYEQIENQIFSYAEKFFLQKYADHKQEDGDKFYPTRLFEEDTDVHIRIEAYEEDVFWAELIDRLVRLHILKDFGKQKLIDMQKEEYGEIIDEYTEKYCKEFEASGLDNLLLDN